MVYLLLPPVSLFGTWAGNTAHRHVDVNAVLLVLQLLVLLSTISLTSATNGEAFGNVMLCCYLLVAIGLAAAVSYVASMHYRFLKERPQLVTLWQQQREKEKREKKTAAAAATEAAAATGNAQQQPQHPPLLNADGSEAGYTEWHP